MRFLLLLTLLTTTACSEDELTFYEPPKSDPDIRDPDLASPNVEEPTVEAPDVEQPAVLGPDHWIDVFQQRDAKVDILWVIDVSDSMEEERTQLAANFTAFMTSLAASGADYQIGVTTTDLSGDGGTLIGPEPVISPLTADPETAFANKVNLTPTDAPEQPLEAARLVLTTSAGAALIRPTAALAVILLTDEDDGSYGTIEYYERTFLAAKGPGNQNLVTISAFAGEVPDGCVIPGFEDVLGAGAASAERIDQIVTATGGAFGSICDSDYSPTLDGIGWQVAGLTLIFPLSREPILGTIEVTVNGTPVSEDPVNGWQYRVDVNSIAFPGDYVPEANSEIEVQYGVVQ